MHPVTAVGASVLSLSIHFHRVSNDSSEATRVLSLIASPSERAKGEDNFNQPYIKDVWNSCYLLFGKYFGASRIISLR